MRTQYVQAVGLRADRTSVLWENAYGFSPARGWVYAQKICFWFLKKIGCERYHDDIKYQTVTINGADFIEKLYRQRHALFEFIGREDIDYVLIGQKDFNELLRKENFQAPYLHEFSFYAAGGVQGGRFGPHRTFAGFRVRVVPWMEGFVAVPKEDY